MSDQKFKVLEVVDVESVPAGFSRYNRGPHLCVEVPNGQSTITVRTSNGRQVTFAFCPYDENGPPMCIDIHHATGDLISQEDVNIGLDLKDRQKLGRPLQRVWCASGGDRPYCSYSSTERERKCPVTLTVLSLERELKLPCTVITKPLVTRDEA